MARAFSLLTVMLIVFSLAAGCQDAGQTIDDASITASVKSKLVAESAANLTAVNVDTKDGVVTLNGSVETADQKTRAEQLAQQVKGVKSIVNNLQVKKT